ncbi:probable peroxygenase 4 isoform X1 [Rhododendron vialii]|uniref:probable peroxygenase 4 isoform X1 n=1 Tax=Rhododendron vialii TaxID=182163 RepID=UPI00265F1D96|nr:probable peroxygenase 4 isoform X1 [Rhododendron vialii]
MASSATDSKTPSNGIQYEGVDGTDQNVLKKHVAFFDRNKDGVIYPWETFQGFRAIGCGLLLSSFAAIFINVGLSRKTRPGKSISLSFPIEVNNIHKSKHGSDSGVYDSEGRFVPSKFEEIFNKHAHTNANALTSEELQSMLKANRVPKDFGGWFGLFSHKQNHTLISFEFSLQINNKMISKFVVVRLASFVEWKILYILCKDKKGLLQKDTVRAVYDGSLFEQMAKEKASSGKQA